ncbi:hypothetical protein [Streptomyces aureus]|uniref:hypothetical protein n=1 Tax=Streptomyces aureus TaxID=193461 RepID=UPI00056C48AB|nr:hypothetical protein [Streptomyces aureus]
MTIAEQLATIDRLCAEEFPTAHSRSVAGSYGGFGGPGFHAVAWELSAGSLPGPEREREVAEQYEAEREALAQRLSDRRGESQWISLDGMFLRAQQGDERIPEPWALLSAHMRNVDVWKAEEVGRWIALGVSGTGRDAEPRLLVVITDIDPP